jgi:hypothetical protein
VSDQNQEAPNTLMANEALDRIATEIGRHVIARISLEHAYGQLADAYQTELEARKEAQAQLAKLSEDVFRADPVDVDTNTVAN